MAIERKDRSFDKIFDQVTLDRIPMDYVMQIKISLLDGNIVHMDKDQISDIGDEVDIVESLERNDIADVEIQLDYESIKKDVSRKVKKVLNKHFKHE
jgi:hypothetical protein